MQSKTKKLSITALNNQVWQQCKRIIRARYGNTCYTCGKPGLEGVDLHTGHLIAKAALGNYLKYDLRVLRPQCFRCNIHMGGMGAEFYKNMVAIEGQEYVDGIFKDRNITVKATDFLTSLLQSYKAIPK